MNKCKSILLGTMFALMLAAPLVSRSAGRIVMDRAVTVSFSNSDEVAEKIRQSLIRRDWCVTVSYDLSGTNTDEIPGLIRGVMDEVFQETDDPCAGDYLYYQYGGYELRYSMSDNENSNRYSVTIIPRYYTDPEQEAAVDAELERVMAGFGFTEDTTEYEKVRAVYDFIKERTSYDIIHKKNDNYHLKSTAYGALINGQAACQGYAVLMYRMLREAGVGVRVVTGTAQYETGDEYHAWNIVCIDGNWYNVDVTWDDQDGGEEYFLRTDDDFPDHLLN